MRVDYKHSFSTVTGVGSQLYRIVAYVSAALHARSHALSAKIEGIGSDAGILTDYHTCAGRE